MKHARRQTPGTAPGTFDTERVRAAQHPHVEITDYTVTSLAAVSNDLDRLGESPVEGVRWIHVAGAPSMEVLERLKTLYSLDALALEDVVNLGQRPKFTEFGDHLFVTLLIPVPAEPGRFEQLSVFADHSYLISFHDGTPGCSTRSASAWRPNRAGCAATMRVICCTR
jgi:magnesium transporter